MGGAGEAESAEDRRSGVTGATVAGDEERLLEEELWEEGTWLLELGALLVAEDPGGGNGLAVLGGGGGGAAAVPLLDPADPEVSGAEVRERFLLSYSA